MDENNFNLTDILGKISSLETRLNNLEAEIKALRSGANKIEVATEEQETVKIINSEEEERVLESKIGEYGLAWIGNFVLFFGIIFLSQYLQNIGYSLLSAILGYSIVGGIFILTRYLDKSFPHLSYLLGIVSHLLFFYITLRLHFFVANPVLSSGALCIVLLLLINAFHFYLAIRNKSEIFGTIALILTTITAIISDSTHIMLPIVAMTALISVVFFYKLNWFKLLIIGQVLVFFALLTWFFSNPFMGRDFEIVKNHQFSILYVFACVIAFSFITLTPKKDTFPSGLVSSSMWLNGLSFSFLLFLYVGKFFDTNYAWLFLSLFIYSLAYSIILKYRSPWKTCSEFYALFSYISFSISVYGFYHLPNAYLLLAFQSLLVVSMALWYRSEVLVVMNMILFILLLIGYLFSSHIVHTINFSFVIVAIATARILNWQKDRLELKTNLLRNFYLIITFFWVLFSLYKAVPEKYVTLSWIGAALFYFGMSYLLKNFKYRWMGIATFIASALNLFIVDMARIEMAYRVLAFLMFAIISLIVSVYYNKHKKNNTGRLEN